MRCEVMLTKGKFLLPLFSKITPLISAAKLRDPHTGHGGFAANPFLPWYMLAQKDAGEHLRVPAWAEAQVSRV